MTNTKSRICARSSLMKFCFSSSRYKIVFGCIEIVCDILPVCKIKKGCRSLMCQGHGITSDIINKLGIV